MYDVEVLDVPRDRGKLQCVPDGGIAPLPREAQRFRHHGTQLGSGPRVATGEQDNVMPPAHQRLRKIMNHTLCPAITPGRNALKQQ